MCHRIQTISKVNNGELSICKNCQIYHLAFNNIYFQFNRAQLLKFRKHIAQIEPDIWEKSHATIKGSRKIPIQTLHENLYLIFNKQELHELNTLLGIHTEFKQQLITLEDIDYPLILN